VPTLSSVFPRHHWRGSIEADFWVDDDVWEALLFPRHHWRGSIEAR